uniref:Uncharacterized protein n=1 Tax=uncultured Caudovirales phage TaxID=2100421 RepID=A0A6J5LAI5_9CAUD|nr:hypothetical protein UFOVP114_89 [uncultured Caudovirales phage]
MAKRKGLSTIYARVEMLTQDTHEAADGDNRAYCYKRALDRLALARKARRHGDGAAADLYRDAAGEYRRLAAAAPATKASEARIAKVRQIVGLA